MANRLTDISGRGVGMERTYTDLNSEESRSDRRNRIADRRSRKSPLFGSVGEKEVNLMVPFHGLGSFDITFCRNAGVYFKMEDRKKLFDSVSKVL